MVSLDDLTVKVGAFLGSNELKMSQLIDSDNKIETDWGEMIVPEGMDYANVFGSVTDKSGAVYLVEEEKHLFFNPAKKVPYKLSEGLFGFKLHYMSAKTMDGYHPNSLNKFNVRWGNV